MPFTILGKIVITTLNSFFFAFKNFQQAFYAYTWTEKYTSGLEWAK